MTRALRSRSGRPPLTGLSDLVRNLPAPTRMLGLTHVTSSYVLREIIASGSISAITECPVLKELVSYTFYGRAAFRGGGDFEPTDLSSLFPTVLIIDPRTVPQPRYVFGFDTGAFVDGMMDQYLHPYMPLFDFMLPPEVISAARITSAMFASANDFFCNEPSGLLSHEASNFEADSFRRIILGGGRGSVRLDDRFSTPEVIFDEPIVISDSVRAAVLPDTLASDVAIGGRLQTLGVALYEYPWIKCSRPGENHALVRQLVQSAYRDFGWL